MPSCRKAISTKLATTMVLFISPHIVSTLAQSSSLGLASLGNSPNTEQKEGPHQLSLWPILFPSSSAHRRGNLSGEVHLGLTTAMQERLEPSCSLYRGRLRKNGHISNEPKEEWCLEHAPKSIDLCGGEAQAMVGTRPVDI